MSIYYVDPAATGANNGSSWTDAWITLQTAADTAVAGDIVYCRGTETLSAQVDYDTNSGDMDTNGYIQFIGCNSSGDEDGTRYILDGNNAAANCICWDGVNRVLLRNFDLKNATGNGFNGSSTNAYGVVLDNVCSHTNGGYGFNAYPLFTGSNFLRCCSYSNSSYGFFNIRSKAIFCCAHDNGNIGFCPNYNPQCLISCLAYDNSGDDYQYIDDGCLLLMCVGNGSSGDGVNVRDAATYGAPILIGNRFTNKVSGKYGIDFASRAVYYGWNVLDGNVDNIANSTLAMIAKYNGNDTNSLSPGDTNQGYTDLTDGSEDFNLTSSATLRRSAISIPTS